MKISSISHAISIGAAIELIAGCNGAHGLIDVPGVTPQVPAVGRVRTVVQVESPPSRYRILYSFRGKSDGARPDAGLLDVNGTLYGTTWWGGKYGDGVVFALTPNGRERVVYSFGGGADGANPDASLIDVHYMLYGTTYYGGPYNRGTVFSISMSGAEHVLHSFGNGNDGQTPDGLIDVNGTLYGATEVGGGPDWGTVFSLIPGAGSAEHALYVFNGFTGGIPEAPLIDLKGTFYGTTAFGGKYGSLSGGGGTVFSVTANGNEQLLHSFGNGYDGLEPAASLVDVSGTLYGTTLSGGAYGSGGAGGTVFSITTSGTERVLHNFGNGTDGQYPWASLLDVKNILYGTTYEGGTHGDGTIFSITTAGSERVLHDFGARPDGMEPTASLINVNGVLYGTTYKGGKYGYGSVFALRLGK